MAILDVHHALALRAVRGHHGVVEVGREEGHGAGAGVGHAHHHGVRGIEHGHAVRCHVLHDDALQHGQVFHGADVGQPEVVAFAHVGDHGHVAAIEGQALAQQAAARGLEHGGVHVGMHQYIAGAARAAAVAGIDALALDVDTVGAGHADAQAAAG